MRIRWQHADCPAAPGRLISLVAGLLLWAPSLAPAAETTPAESGTAGPVDFATDLAPLLAERCVSCHNASIAKGSLDLSTSAAMLAGGDSGAAIEPGDADSSTLVYMIESLGDRPEMPKEGEPFTPEEVALVRRWIDQGAAWPDDLTLAPPSKADRSWWSLQALNVVEPQLPDDIPITWTRNPIDRYIYAALAEQGLKPSRRADRRTLIRRATYDLTGLPPTPEEVAEFLADNAPGAYERLIDRLLASPRYGERWGRHWLDVIRFGESNGYERNVLIENVWPLRDYVIRSLNDDKPFDQLVLEHLAGDVLGPNQPDVAVGTTFLVCGPYDNVNNQDPVQKAQIRANTIDEIIRATSEAFLGLTVGCARCHDHKFDPITQRDYHSLYATFAGVKHGERIVATDQQREQHAAQSKPLFAERRELTERKEKLEKRVLARAEANAAEYESRWTRPAVDRYGTEETFEPVMARYVRLAVAGNENDPHATAGYNIDEFEIWTADDATPRNVALASAGGRAEGLSRKAEDFMDAYSVRRVNDGQYNARWIAEGPELTITLAQPERIGRVIFSSDRLRALGENKKTTFVADYRLLISQDGHEWQEIASSYDRQPLDKKHRTGRLLAMAITDAEQQELAELDEALARVNADLAAVPRMPSWWVGQFETAPGPFHVFLGGDPQRLGGTAHAASLSTLAEVTQGYELDDAQSEAERRMALARWITAQDNPLTPRVLVNRLWHYHFGTGIVDTPSDFGYMGGRPTHPELLDWLATQVHEHGWRLKPLHRQIMLSETYRQASATRAEAAQVDGDSRYFWRFPPRRLSSEEIRDTCLAISGRLDLRMGGPGFRLYRYLVDNVATYLPLDEHGPETYRRAVYHQNARAMLIDLMSEFDSPDCAFATARRASTTTPLQALTMLNHSFTLDMAEALAERLQSEAPDDLDTQLRRAFQLAYARDPRPGELRACAQLAEEHGLRAYCRVLLNTSELIYVD